MIDIFKCFQIISKHTNEFLDSKLKDVGLCSCHRIFIKKIYENPGITRDKLKMITHVHPSNTTRAIDYLEEKNFIIKKNKEEDKRICELYPTSSLAIAYKIVIDAEKEWINLITKGMNDEEIKLYTDFLNKSTDLSIECIHKK